MKTNKGLIVLASAPFAFMAVTGVVGIALVATSPEAPEVAEVVEPPAPVELPAPVVVQAPEPEPKPTVTIGEADAVHFYLDAPNEQTIGESTFDGTTVTWSSEIKNGRYSNTFYRYKCNVKTGELGIKWRHLNMNKTNYERCEVRMSNGFPVSARMVAEDGYVSQDIRFTF